MPLAQRQNELANVTAAFADLMYNDIGIESDELDASTERLNLEGNDKEYNDMCTDYLTEVKKINLNAEWQRFFI